MGGLSVRVLVCLAMASTFLMGQRVPYLEAGNVEIGGFGGFATGLGRTASGVGGNLAVAGSKYILPYGEVTYFPGLSSLARSQHISGNSVNLTSSTKVSFSDYHFGVHLRAANIFKRSDIMPYGVIGAGALRNSTSSGHVSGTVDGAPFERDVTLQSNTSFAVNFGGGLRIYTKDNFGFRIEVKGYKPTGSGPSTDPFMKLTFGVFYYVKK